MESSGRGRQPQGPGRTLFADRLDMGSEGKTSRLTPKVRELSKRTCRKIFSSDSWVKTRHFNVIAIIFHLIFY